MISTEFSQQGKYENQILCPTSFRRNNSSNAKSPLQKENAGLGQDQKFVSSSHTWGNASHTKEKKIIFKHKPITEHIC